MRIILFIKIESYGFSLSINIFFSLNTPAALPQLITWKTAKYLVPEAARCLLGSFKAYLLNPSPLSLSRGPRGPPVLVLGESLITIICRC